MKKTLLILICTLVSLASYAQQGAIKGKVVSRADRVAVGNVEVTIDSTGQTVKTDQEGNFWLGNLPKGDYKLTFTNADFETLDLVVRVGENEKNLNSVIMAPAAQGETQDDSIFAEFDNDSSASDTSALPSSLSASKDIFNNIASYRFSEMRFNVRGYDSQYTDVYLNGIRFNDAMTSYGPWSLWSGMNDATRNQENTAGLEASEHGIGGFGGSTNINARASQMRKGFRASVSNGNQMYRFRAIVSYASGALDNGWSYAFSVSTRQGGNGYVDGVYYNSYGYFAAAEKVFGSHRLSLMVLGTPQQRGAQQASTQEAYDMFGSNYYNPNVGLQGDKLRNTRVRRSHEPIVMLNYYYDISEKTRLTAATSVRFGYNGYSALTWKDGSDPRPDYYRYLPSYYTSQITTAVPGILDESADKNGLSITNNQLMEYALAAAQMKANWNGRINFANLYEANQYEDPTTAGYASGKRANYMIEERHTDQIDYNFVANIAHQFNQNNRINGGISARVNRTEYFTTVGDLLGGDYWVDTDKFAERDMGGNELAYQNDVDYYKEHGHARIAKEGDKYSYDYYAHVRQAKAWALYSYTVGGFAMQLGGELGYAGLWRQGLWRKGLFAEGNDSYGDSKHLDYLTYKAKANFSYRFSGAHSIAANVMMLQDAPTFNTAFVSARTRNQVTPGLKAYNVFGAEFTYNLNLPYIKARVSAYYTKMNDLAKVISFYDDTQSSFTNFAMSDIDKQYMGVELGMKVPIAWGLAFQGAVSWGDYRYTSNPNFVQIVDNSATVKLVDKVYWKDYYVESTPQLAINAGLDFRGPKNWFASVNFNYYDKIYLSMNPAYRTTNAVKSYVDVLNNATDAKTKIWAKQNIDSIQAQEDLGNAYTLAASVGKNFSIQRKYTLGFSLEVKNILNNQNIKTGGYEQMRMHKFRGMSIDESGASVNPSTTYYTRFDSKYFYMLGTTCFVNVYFRF